jgi:hypothetical protein
MTSKATMMKGDTMMDRGGNNEEEEEERDTRLRGKDDKEGTRL